jgi:hypothetical protein
MNTTFFMRSRRHAALAAALALGVAAAPSAVRGADPAGCPSSTESAYPVAVSALTGPTRTDVALRFGAAPGCGAVTAVKHVQIKTFTQDGGVAGTRILDDVEAPDGVASVVLDRVERGRRIETDALIQTGTPPRTYVVRGETTSRLRPDVAVTAVHTSAKYTLTTRPVDLTVDLSELRGDTGATVEVALSSGIGPVGQSMKATVPADGHVSVAFPGISLTEPATVTLKAVVSEAVPGEYDATADSNNDGSVVVEVTRNELARSSVLVQSLGGYGFQFNQHLYAPITNPPPETLPDVEAKVRALSPQLVRVFFNERWEWNTEPKLFPHPEWQQNLDSFRRVVHLADEAGAAIVITYHTTAVAKTNPTLWMDKFADELQELVVNRGLEGVQWALIQNEPNSTGVTQAQYEALYRALDSALRTRGLRDRIGLIGGDLLQNTEGTSGGHRAWFDYMVEHMNDVIDAWDEHIYWNYWDPRRMEERLKDVAHLVHSELPEQARKPTLLMEYGVRGSDTCGTNPTVKFAYYVTDGSCTPVREMALAGFHKLWFSILAAQLGFEGASNWDLYWSYYDNSGLPTQKLPNQSFWAIGLDDDSWEVYPSYDALRLLLQTTERGWQVLEVGPVEEDDLAASIPARIENPASWHWDTLEQELTAFRGPDGQLTILGLDSNGGQQITPNGQSSSYSIGGLPENTTFTLATWNAAGDGRNAVAEKITTNDAGVARFDVPLQAAFALTTLPVA